MTDQERKQRILTKLRNILFLLLGITVLFISISSIIQAHHQPNAVFSNLIWIILALIVIVQAILSIIQSFQVISQKQKIFLAVDWVIIISGILLSNFAYSLKSNLWLIIGIAIFIAGCIPIKE